MARPLVSAVYTAARSHAGDAAGQFYTATTGSALEPFYKFAYSELFRAMQGTQSPRVRRETYYDLPAYTSILDPATASITDLGEIESLEERGSVTEKTITGVTVSGATATVTTSTAHGFSTGDQIVQFGIVGLSDDANGLFTITSTGSTTYTANGCTASGTYVSGGTAAKSTEDFTAVIGPKRIISTFSAPQNTLGEYSWENDIFRFPPCSALRQLRITYTLSGSAPLTASLTVPIDDSLDFLAFRTAGLALQARGAHAKAKMLNEVAVGSDWGRGVTGGILDQLLSAGVRALQNLPQDQLRSASRYQKSSQVIW